MWPPVPHRHVDPSRKQCLIDNGKEKSVAHLDQDMVEGLWVGNIQDVGLKDFSMIRNPLVADRNAHPKYSLQSNDAAIYMKTFKLNRDIKLQKTDMFP